MKITTKSGEEALAQELKRSLRKIEQLRAVLSDLPAAMSEAGAEDGWVPFPHWEEFVNKVNKVLEDTK